MELSANERKIHDEAVGYVKDHRDELIQKFVLSKNPLQVGFISIFMAGSPGAGKTEFTRRYLPELIDAKNKKIMEILKKNKFDAGQVDTLLIRIDVDEIREWLPQYRKTDIANNVNGNAHVIQSAANKGLDFIRDYCLKNEISFLHDGTFGNYSTMRELIKKSLRNGRNVEIFYIYMDPLAAWEFTLAREYLEGRNIIKEKFIEQFFASMENMDKVRKDFGQDIAIHCVLKNEKNEIITTRFNVESVSSFMKAEHKKGRIKEYTREDLLTLLGDDIL